jgi:sugar transferase (PEP-CTERM/EpsH1 system associated)
MAPLLYLTHRIPYPPNKGDKVRSYHLLRFLARRYAVHLGTFVDDDADRAHEGALAPLCASTHVATIHPTRARIRSLAGLFSGEALTLGYYRDEGLAQWVRATVARHGITRVVVFSSAMAQYVTDLAGVRTVVDFVDVDSAKWEQYGRSRAWPLSQIYRREGDRLLAFERAVARAADASVFVTAAEADLFRRKAPECAARVSFAQNGVDTDYFAPDEARESPFAPDEEALVFTGAMDYWPNVDAVCWFAHEILPAIRAARPQARFHIVGMQPAPTVQALARLPGVAVTGRVPDVRPYLQHARVVVAPLRVARGIQNKVLEAMAMARPVVVSACAAEGLSARRSEEIEVAEDAATFAARVLAAMAPGDAQRLGAAARVRAVTDYDWAANLAPFARLIEDADALRVRAS